jgi:hypothetical protein
MNTAYHFVGKTLRYGSPIPPNGEWLTFTGEVKICKSGLHASYNPFDALEYAPGSTLCKVEIEEIVDSHKDKIVCRRRKIIGRVDATEMLYYFARMQALSVVDKWDAPDVVLDYLMTGDKKIKSAAHSAVYSAAAHSAVYSAAGRSAAGRFAAYSAAGYAAAYFADAHAVAYSVADSVAHAAADHSAAYSAAGYAAAYSAAYSAAGYAAAYFAAHSVAHAAADEMFNQLVSELEWT